MYHVKDQELIYLRLITVTLLLVGGIAWGIIGSVGYNPISRFFKYAEMGMLSRLIYLMIGLSAVLYIYLFFNSKTFLPFLDASLFPSQIISINKPLNFNHEVILNAPKDATMIVYWTSSDQKQFENAASNKVQDGKATLYISDPKDNFRVYYRWIKAGSLDAVNFVDV